MTREILILGGGGGGNLHTTMTYAPKNTVPALSAEKTSEWMRSRERCTKGPNPIG